MRKTGEWKPGAPLMEPAAPIIRSPFPGFEPKELGTQVGEEVDGEEDKVVDEEVDKEVGQGSKLRSAH